MSLGGSSKASAEKKDSTTEEDREEVSTGVTTTKTVLEQEAIDKIIQDVLGGTGGLAEIFAGEQTAGVFDSSVANQAAGDLVAQLVGELTKIQSEQVTTNDSLASSAAKSRTETNEFGLEVETHAATK